MDNKPYISTPRDFGGQVHAGPSFGSAVGPYLDRGDFLQILSATTNASASLEFMYRFMSLSGEIVSGRATVVFSGTGVQTPVIVPVGNGWLIGFDLHVLTGTVIEGQVQASVHIANATGAGGFNEVSLASGELSNTRSLGLGAYTSRSVVVSQTVGTFTVVNVANPAAGVDWTTTVPAGNTWQVQAITATLTTAVAAGSRGPSFGFDNGSVTLGRQGNNSLIAASTTGIVSMGIGMSVAVDIVSPTQLTSAGLWNTTLGAGFRVFSNTINIQAADQWSAINLYVLQTPTS